MSSFSLTISPLTVLDQDSEGNEKDLLEARAIPAFVPRGLDTFLVWTRMIPVAALALRMRINSFDIWRRECHSHCSRKRNTDDKRAPGSEGICFGEKLCCRVVHLRSMPHQIGAGYAITSRLLMRMTVYSRSLGGHGWPDAELYDPWEPSSTLLFAGYR